MVGSRTRAPTRTAEHHHARPAVVAVGLERRLPDEPEHLPSARPEPCDPSRLGDARCSRATPRPAPCRSPRAWACPVKGLLVASSYPPVPLRTACAALAEARRKMRLTDFCNRLPSRAPCGLLDSRLRSSPHRIAACGPRALRHEPSAGSSWAIGLAAARHGSPADPLSGCADQVELRLTANLLLRPPPQSSRDPSRGAPWGRTLRELCPNTHVSGTARSWRGSRS